MFLSVMYCMSHTYVYNDFMSNNLRKQVCTWHSMCTCVCDCEVRVYHIQESTQTEPRGGQRRNEIENQMSGKVRTLFENRPLIFQVCVTCQGVSCLDHGRLCVVHNAIWIMPQMQCVCVCVCVCVCSCIIYCRYRPYPDTPHL